MRYMQVGSKMLGIAFIAALAGVAGAQEKAGGPAGARPPMAGPGCALIPTDAPPPKADLPAVMHAGMRITWVSGDAVVQGVRAKLVRDPNGNWVDPKTQKRYSEEETRSSGGVGYMQVTIVHAAPDLIVADGRNFIITDVARNQCSFSGGFACSGTGAALGDLWIHPARLAALKDVNEKDLTLTHAPYTLNGREYRAVLVRSESDTGCSQYTYDCATGLLLVSSTSNTGTQVPTLGPNGTVNSGAGSAAITTCTLVTARPVTTPWAAEAPPTWASKGRQINYQGTTGQANSSLPPMQLQVQVTVADAGADWATTHIVRRAAYPNTPTTEVVQERVAASMAAPGTWIGLKAIASMKPGAVIDEDPNTRFRVVFAGVQNNAAVLVEQNETDRTDYIYDATSGLLVGMRTMNQSAVGPVQTQIQVVPTE